jgi:hypothetical protein
MKVICKSLKDYTDDLFWQGSLTIGKEYDILNKPFDIPSGEYIIMSDYGFEHLYPVKCFVTKQDIREDKLNELGI